jgi:hypothetical protein
MGKKMSKKNRNELCGKLEWEGGYEYLVTGSDFANIEDERFHELRKAFVKAYKELDEYVGYPAYLDMLGGE